MKYQLSIINSKTDEFIVKKEQLDSRILEKGCRLAILNYTGSCTQVMLDTVLSGKVYENDKYIIVLE